MAGKIASLANWFDSYLLGIIAGSSFRDCSSSSPIILQAPNEISFYLLLFDSFVSLELYTDIMNDGVGFHS